MDINEFTQILEAEQRREFVALAGTKVAYLSQITNAHRKAGTDLARNMVIASKQMFPDDPSRWLTLSGIRPDIWQPGEAA